MSHSDNLSASRPCCGQIKQVIVDLFYTPQEKLTGRIKQTNYSTDKPRERDRKR